jgi:hypothetical protein
MLPESKSFVKLDGERASRLMQKIELRHQFPCGKIDEL